MVLPGERPTVGPVEDSECGEWVFHLELHANNDSQRHPGLGHFRC